MNNQEKKPLHESIKQASASSHQNLEKKIIERLKNIESPKDYASLLAYFYHYFSRLELLIAAHLPTNILPDYKQRRKSELLQNDIKDLGFETASIPTLHLPEINDAITAMGALYVMEGSTLGGSMIVKILAHKGMTAGTSFFNGYGHKTGAMWGVFLEALNGVAEDQKEEDKAIQTVRQTFEYFSEFIVNTKEEMLQQSCKTL